MDYGEYRARRLDAVTTFDRERACPPPPPPSPRVIAFVTRDSVKFTVRLFFSLPSSLLITLLCGSELASLLAIFRYWMRYLLEKFLLLGGRIYPPENRIEKLSRFSQPSSCDESKKSNSNRWNFEGRESGVKSARRIYSQAGN